MHSPQSRLNNFPENFGDVSDAQDEGFHQDIRLMEKWWKWFRMREWWKLLLESKKGQATLIWLEKIKENNFLGIIYMCYWIFEYLSRIFDLSHV